MASSSQGDPPANYLTSNQGVKISDTDNWLKISDGTHVGPHLLEDQLAREKIMHLDHERIPERVVHARGTGAHGYFKVHDDRASKYTYAPVLTDPSRETPVFVRFSTVQGSRGSSDTVRDVRGFATKFYTPEGNWDLVGNNIPIFFIQEAIKFPDFVHAVKPEPHNEVPQGQSAHNNFWDFVGLQPECKAPLVYESSHFIHRALTTSRPYGHVGYVRPRDTAVLENDAGLWRQHLHSIYAPRRAILCEIPLDSRTRSS